MTALSVQRKARRATTYQRSHFIDYASRRAGWAAPALAKLQGAAMLSVRLPYLNEMAECVSTFKL